MVDDKCSSWLNILHTVCRRGPFRALCFFFFCRFFFFVIFISDPPEVVAQGSTLALYADDRKAFRVVTSPNGQLMFQGDLDKLR